MYACVCRPRPWPVTADRVLLGERRHAQRAVSVILLECGCLFHGHWHAWNPVSDLDGVKQSSHLEVLAAHQAGVDIDGAQRHRAAFLKIKIQVLHDTFPLVMQRGRQSGLSCSSQRTWREIVSRYGHSEPFFTVGPRDCWRFHCSSCSSSSSSSPSTSGFTSILGLAAGTASSAKLWFTSGCCTPICNVPQSAFSQSAALTEEHREAPHAATLQELARLLQT